MEREYSNRQIYRNRRIIYKWSLGLMIAGIFFAYLFVSTDESIPLQWWLLAISGISSLVGLIGLIILDLTKTPRSRYHFE